MSAYAINEVLARIEDASTEALMTEMAEASIGDALDGFAKDCAGEIEEAMQAFFATRDPHEAFSELGRQMSIISIEWLDAHRDRVVRAAREMHGL